MTYVIGNACWHYVLPFDELLVILMGASFELPSLQ